MPDRLLTGFENQVRISPLATAVIDADREFSYRRLDQESSTMARHLRQQGVGVDKVIGIYVNRSYEAILSILSVLKAGACYLPLDPGFPSSRLEYMLRDAQVGKVMTLSSMDLSPLGGELDITFIDGLKNAAPDGSADRSQREELFSSASDHLAYLMYTSGSTGAPKGVAMERGPLERVVEWQLSNSSAGAGDRTLQFSPLGFDVSFQEILATLSSGGALVIIQDEQRMDGGKLLEVVRTWEVNRLFLPFVALQVLVDSAHRLRLYPESLREVVTAGEALRVTDKLRGFFRRLPRCRLQNQYGPTESHVVTAYSLEGAPDSWPDLPPIGSPLPHAQVLVLNDRMLPVEPGRPGEIYLGGESLARGYLGRPELTSQRFISVEGKRFYRTGDMARWREDGGGLDFLGRTDNQVKNRGYRVEPGEIEVCLSNHPGIAQAVVDVRVDKNGAPQLVAWYQGEPTSTSDLRQFLGATLPEYMIPARFMNVQGLPRTPSGKVDRKALPDPTGKRPILANDYLEPETPVQQIVANLWSDMLDIAPVGISDNFFDIGGNSLLGLRFVASLKRETEIDLPVTTLFDHPTIAGLSEKIDNNPRIQMRGTDSKANNENHETDDHEHTRENRKYQPIAVVGMAVKLPDAESLDEYWANLLAGRESIRFFKPSDVTEERPGCIDDEERVFAKALVSEPGRFDAEFFGISPREAEVIDPQQRVFLELSWSALENAGYAPRSSDERVGVFAGTANNSYLPNNLARRPDVLERASAFSVMTGNEKDYVASRVSHKLGLTGPAISVHTACSTSLVAVHQAVQALRVGECEMALAGGATISAPQREGYVYREGEMLSADGHCRPFDSQASGTVFSDGAGAVVLKPLSAARKQGDHIYAVIEGSAVNNDGGQKASFSAPNVEGQKKVILQAQREAGICAGDLQYVEAHGTGTPVGDPIEVRALNEAFRLNGGSLACLIGSVKSNFGHLTASAGIVGLIKAALMVERGRVPPTLHFRQGNPTADWGATPFRVNSVSEDWPEVRRRRAAVSSFGVGGTNAHVILAEPPLAASSESSRPRQILVLSHRSKQGLKVQEANLSKALKDRQLNLADVAFTLNSGRERFSQISTVVADSRETALEALQQRQSPAYRCWTASDRRHEAAFLFPGQGVQHCGMAQSLYETEPVFQDCVDRSAEILKPLLGEDIRPLLYPEIFRRQCGSKKLTRTLYAQLSLFTVEYALAELWLHWGVQPAALFGHSVGEWVAACVAGTVTHADALRAVYHRGRLLQAQPAGNMLAVQSSREEVLEMLSDDLDVAAVNGQTNTVVAGSREAIAEFSEQCGDKLPTRLLATSHAFHSRMMEGALEEFRREISGVDFKPPRIPFISCVSGDWISDGEATSPDYWVRQIRCTVQCASAMERLTEQDSLLALELGPGETITSLFRQTTSLRKSNAGAVPTLGKQGDGDWPNVLDAVAHAVRHRLPFDWHKFYAGEKRSRVPLPGYPFEGANYWIYSDMDNVGKNHLPKNNARESDSKPMETDENRRTDNPGSDAVLSAVRKIVEKITGFQLDGVSDHQNFFEIGLDSLLLTQVATALKREFEVTVSFRQLTEQCSSLAAVADLLRPQVDLSQSEPPQDSPRSPSGRRQTPEGSPAGHDHNYDDIHDKDSLPAVISRQLELMSRQLEMLNVREVEEGNVAQADLSCEPGPGSSSPPDSHKNKGQGAVFAAQARIETRPPNDMSVEIKKNLEAFIDGYVVRTGSSRRFTQNNRKKLADPRAVSGFHPWFKEMVYPIVVKASEGSRLWDLDDNEYIDLVNGFGSNFLGHSPDCVKQALHSQLESGWEIGSQTPLVADVAQLLCEITGMERATFCNTGSEAVMGALRLARTVTGRDKVVMFDGAYHGINDEQIARKASGGRSVPGAAGIPSESSANVIVLDYGRDEALEFVREHGEELAAVLVEPVQSRRPDFQPGRFLTALRAATAEADVALIFDEVITGFRVRPGGAQEYFGIRADLAAYGKVIGGGMPIGAIAGSAKYMDALDGGDWRFGDDSFPQKGVTYFAGTFVRHPLAMAAARAALNFIKEQGPQLQQGLSEKCQRLRDEVNQYYGLLGFPFKLKNYGSLFKVDFDDSRPLARVYFYKLRELGVHIWEGRPCFLTVAHSGRDMDFLANAFKNAADFMLQNRFIESPTTDPGGHRTVDHTSNDLEKTGSLRNSDDNTTTEFAFNETIGRQEMEIHPDDTVVSDALVESTEAQREIWLAAQMHEGVNCAFNESLSVSLRGQLDWEVLNEALTMLVRRHDALRIRFGSDGRKLIPGAPHSVDLTVLDLSEKPGPLAEEEYGRLAREVVSEPFDLARGPLLRFELVKLAHDEYRLIITCHHIICDGWSIYMLAHEIGKLYSAQQNGTDLPPASSFLDYARWERSTALREKRRASLGYWKDKLSNSAPFLELPLDKARPPVKTYTAQRLDRTLSAGFIPQARKAAAANRATLTSWFSAGFAAFMYRLTGHREVLFGMPFAGQLAKDDLELVGHCVNLLPMKIAVSGHQSFKELLSEVQAEMLQASDYQHMTFGTLLQTLDFKRDPSRPALLSTLFNVDINADEEWAFGGLDASMTSNPRRYENFDLSLNVTVTGNRATLECTFNTDLWNSETVHNRLKELETLLEAALSAPDQPVGELEILPSDERRLLNTVCTGAAVSREIQHMTELLDLQKYGERTAVVCGGESVNFLELEQRANRLANHLIEVGVSHGDLLGVFIERSVDMLVSLLATWKAGAAYVALDPGYPVDRLLYMAETAQLRALITESDLDRDMDDYSCARVYLDKDQKTIAQKSHQAPPSKGSGDDTAYVIFTSGSTGKPKGVEVTHGGLVNFLYSMAEAPGLQASHRFLAVTTLSFDIAVMELCLPLMVGAQMTIADRESALDGYRLLELINEHEINAMQATPTTWRWMLAAGWRGGKSFKAMCGGEAFPLDLARQLMECVEEVWNMYGPTETTIWSTCYRLEPAGVDGPIPIGPPIANTQCYVMDENQKLLPAGVPGELYIGGDGVAKGYLQRPDLTEERFIPDPIGGQGRLYRTGDQAKWQKAGYLECLGRLDSQVKVRGYRIELGEIEAALSKHPDVTECAAKVVRYSDSDHRLVAYARVAEGSRLNGTEMRRHLRSFLPDYMIPQLFVTMDALPLTPNGKIDRKSLPDPSLKAGQSSQVARPQTDTEKQLAEIWGELLRREQESVDEVFFDVGGHSLLAMDMIAQIQERFGVRVSALDVLVNTLEQIAARIDGSRTESTQSAEGSEDVVGANQLGKSVTAEASRRKSGILGRLLGRQLF